MKFNNSTLPNDIYVNAVGNSMSWGQQYGEMCVQGIMEAMAQYLASVKKDAPKACKICSKDSLTDGFEFGAFIEKVDTEDGASYNLTYTFDESDLPEGVEPVTFSDYVLQSIVSKICSDKFNIRFKESNGMFTANKIMAIIAQTMKEYFRKNANMEDNTIKIDGVCEFIPSVHDEKLVIAVELDPVIKQIVKDDAELAEQAETAAN